MLAAESPAVLCPHCGYDLRGSFAPKKPGAHHVLCPECGLRGNPTNTFLQRRPFAAVGLLLLPAALFWVVFSVARLIGTPGIAPTAIALVPSGSVAIPCGMIAGYLAARPRTDIGAT
jgi:hypothetical protein